MNSVDGTISNARSNERQKNRHERQVSVELDKSGWEDDSRNLAWRSVTIAVVATFWVGQFGASTLYTQLNAPSASIVTLLPRTIVCLLGALISLAFIAAQDRRRSASLAVKAYWAIACAILSAAMLGVINHFIFEAFLGPQGTSGFWISLPLEVVPRLWVFASVYAMSLAISYAIDLREREEQIARLKALAQDAQLRALRSQLNPHFLFNALNSVAALIRDERPADAERITEGLADFLRITLSLDPQRLITLREECALQRIYLDIQELRFPTRLKVQFQIDPAVESALVPNLILQPQIENSIKHAVGRSTKPVTLSVTASTPEPGLLQVLVEDDGGNAAGSPAKGNRMGLSNVAERLRVQFGEAGRFTAVPRSGGGFRNLMIVPLLKAS